MSGEERSRSGRRRAPGTAIWEEPRPARGGRRPPARTRAEIAAAAMAVADAEGADAVSMRRVARELGVGAMTLYHYVDGKDDLLDLMSDAVVGEFLVAADELPGDWRGGLAAIARATRAAFERHPWALAGLRHPSGGPNGMRHFEQSLAVVADLALDAVTRIELIANVDDFVIGFVIREQLQRGHARADAEAGEELRRAVLAFLDRELKTGRYPNVEALIAEHDAEELLSAAMSEDRFERGLGRLLDGIGAELRGR